MSSCFLFSCRLYPHGTLQTFLEQTKPLSPIERLQKRLELFQTLLHTLALLHQAGLSHRDLKPSNVLIDEDDMPVVADFEISRDDTHVVRALRRSGARCAASHRRTPALSSDFADSLGFR